MNIHFYLDNEQEKPITSLYDSQSNPFKVNDVIRLNVDELLPIEYNSYRRDYIQRIRNENKENRELFHLKSIKLVRERKYININPLDGDLLTIEYHCKLIDE